MLESKGEWGANVSSLLFSNNKTCFLSYQFYNETGQFCLAFKALLDLTTPTLAKFVSLFSFLHSVPQSTLV